MISKLLLLAVVCNVVTSAPVIRRDDGDSDQTAPTLNNVPTEEITSAQDNINNVIDTTSKQLTSVLEGDTDDANENATVLDEILDKGVITTAQDKIKNTLNTAGQVANKVQNRVTNTLKTARANARQVVADQNKVIGDTVVALARLTSELSQSGLNFVSSIPELGFSFLEALGR